MYCNLKVANVEVKFVDKTLGLSCVNIVMMVMMRAPAPKAGKDFVSRALTF